MINILKTLVLDFSADAIKAKSCQIDKTRFNKLSKATPG